MYMYIFIECVYIKSYVCIYSLNVLWGLDPWPLDSPGHPKLLKRFFLNKRTQGKINRFKNDKFISQKESNSCCNNSYLCICYACVPAVRTYIFTKKCIIKPLWEIGLWLRFPRFILISLKKITIKTQSHLANDVAFMGPCQIWKNEQRCCSQTSQKSVTLKCARVCVCGLYVFLPGGSTITFKPKISIHQTSIKFTANDCST